MTIQHAVGTTSTEAEVLAATQAAIAAGADPFGDDDTGVTTEDDQASNGAADAASPAGDEGLTAEQLDAIAGEGAATDEVQNAEQAATEGSTEEPGQRQYRVDTPEALNTAKKELRDKKNKAFQDYSDGVIDAAEFSRIDDEVADALEQLTVQRTLHAANVQAEADTMTTALDAIIKAAKDAGEIDYQADASAAKQFDAAMQMIAADGKTRTVAQLTRAAHKAVLSARGITAKPDATAEATAEPAKPRENGKGPMTLREVPAASVPNAGGTWQDQLAGLKGQAYEEAFAALTPAQKAALLN